MLRGKNVSLRVMNTEEIVPHAHSLNRTGKFDTRGFAFVSPIQLMNNHVTSSQMSEEDAIFAIDTMDRMHAGFARYFYANPAVRNLEIEVVFYEKEQNTTPHRQEAMTLLAHYLFQDRPIKRVQLLLRQGDRVGEEAAKESGFKKEGTLRQMVFASGDWQDLDLYSVMREDLLNV